MRVVQAVGWYFPDSLGGTELYVQALAQRLTQVGHEVVVAAPAPGAVAMRHYEHDGITVLRYPIPERPTREEVRGDAVARGAETFHAWLSAIRPDVVHFHTFVTGLGLREVIAAKRAGAKVVVTSHAGSLGFLCERGTLMRDGTTVCDGNVSPLVCASCALKARGVPPWAASLMATIPAGMSSTALAFSGQLSTASGMRALVERSRASQRELFLHIDTFVALTEWASNALITRGAPPDKVVINRLGVPAAFANVPRANRPASAPVVCGFVGRAESIKGLEDAVRAVVSLPDADSIRLRVVAVCSGDEEAALVNRCRAWASGDHRIRFETGTPRSEIASLLASLDLLLCPSRVVEGGPTVALEARAVGTPVIGARVPALTEIIADRVDGLLHEPGNWRELADCLHAVAQDPSGTVGFWRANLRNPRWQDEVAADYLALYGAA